MNKTIKVIDLLNKKADGEEIPKKILFEGDIFELDNDNCYIDTKGSCYFIESVNFNLSNLNDTVEIIEDEDINIQDIEHKELEIIQENLGKCDLWKGNEEYILKVINENNSRLVDAILQVSKENGVLVQAVKQLDKTKEDK